MVAYTKIFALLLFMCSVSVYGGVMMTPIELPASGSSVWALRDIGKDRFSGGWLPLDVPVAGTTSSSWTPVPLLLGWRSVGRLHVWPRIWDADISIGQLSAVDRYLLRWPLFLDLDRLSVPAFRLTETMLLIPDQVRIRLDALSLEELGEPGE